MLNQERAETKVPVPFKLDRRRPHCANITYILRIRKVQCGHGVDYLISVILKGTLPCGPKFKITESYL